ncbi:hypothetical protein LJR030_004261 [Rhizobium sp. LjRoot30]|uniref:hypothetical protein n=1 Tax=Rhizobium sp. LjRoot30 TaxID=3342320 RepID=UPI003ECD5FD6
MRSPVLADMPKAIRCRFPTARRACPGTTVPTRREQRRYRAKALLLILAVSGGLALLLFCGSR